MGLEIKKTATAKAGQWSQKRNSTKPKQKLKRHQGQNLNQKKERWSRTAKEKAEQQNQKPNQGQSTVKGNSTADGFGGLENKSAPKPNQGPRAKASQSKKKKAKRKIKNQKSERQQPGGGRNGGRGF